jgi:hypothetical protein
MRALLPSSDNHVGQYGTINGYVKPKEKLAGSIMSLSNTGTRNPQGYCISLLYLRNMHIATAITFCAIATYSYLVGGAGRGGFNGNIVGDVILKGKKKYWERGADWFYHQGLQAGENTLEGHITRMITNSLSEK